MLSVDCSAHAPCAVESASLVYYLKWFKSIFQHHGSGLRKMAHKYTALLCSLSLLSSLHAAHMDGGGVRMGTKSVLSLFFSSVVLIEATMVQCAHTHTMICVQTYTHSLTPSLT